MDGPRRSERKRNQTDFLGATETLRDARRERPATSRARAAAIAAAYEPLGGLQQLGEAGGGEGRVWVGAEDSPALGGFAPTPMRAGAGAGAGLGGGAGLPARAALTRTASHPPFILRCTHLVVAASRTAAGGPSGQGAGQPPRERIP
jgi:hypothetical protein